MAINVVTKFTHLNIGLSLSFLCNLAQFVPFQVTFLLGVVAVVFLKQKTHLKIENNAADR